MLFLKIMILFLIEKLFINKKKINFNKEEDENIFYFDNFINETKLFLFN